MKIDIDTANAAKQELLNRFGSGLASVTLILGNKGLRIEARCLPGISIEQQPLVIRGLPVYWS